MDGYANANRLKPSGIAGKKSVLKMHLIPHLGDKRLDAIGTEDVQRLKSALGDRAAKTVNNILTVLSVMLKSAVEWGSIQRVPCVIKLLPTPKNQASFHDFEEFERLVDASRSDLQTYLVVLLGGDAFPCKPVGRADAPPCMRTLARPGAGQCDRRCRRFHRCRATHQRIEECRPNARGHRRRRCHRQELPSSYLLSGRRP